MGKKKKKGLPLFIILLLVVGVGAAIYYYWDDIDLFEQAFSPGCAFIENEEDPDNIYTHVLSQNRFTCGEDNPQEAECIVQGWMKIDQGNGQNVVGCLESGRGECSIVNFDTLGECEAARPWDRCVGSTYDTGPVCYECGYVQETIYDGYFNFDPAGQTTFPQGSNGDDNYRIGAQGEAYITDEYTLNRGESVIFAAQYGDSTLIPNNMEDKQIRVKSCDNTCVDKVAAGDACDPDRPQDVYCEPETGGHYPLSDTCYWKNNPPGVYCPDGTEAYYLDLDDCYYFGQSKAYCDASDLSQHRKCTLNRDADGCYTWGQLQSAGGNLACYVGSSTGVTGVGELKCSQGGCGVGDKESYPGGAEDEYRECILDADGCSTWSSKRFCPSGLIFSDAVDDCVCPPAEGLPGDAVCISDTQRLVYSTQVVSGLMCTVSNTESLPAGSEKVCRAGIFTCEPVNRCEQGEIQCATLRSYRTCMLDPSDPANSCLDFRNLQDTGPGEICVGDRITADPEQGCAFDTPGAECDTSSGFVCDEVRGSDTYNDCICDPTNPNIATSEDFFANNQRCLGDQPQQVERIGTGTPEGACYEWVDMGPVCGVDEICREMP